MRPHAYLPDAAGLYCQICNLPRRHSVHHIQPLDPWRKPYKDDDTDVKDDA